MAEFQNFRSALGGFNREDVVHYIEYINHKHAAQLNQLKTEIQALQTELAELQADASLFQRLEEANARIAQLERELEEAKAVPAPQEKSEDELEAYRRAERAERRAAERVAQMYDQASATLADAASRADDSATQVSELANALNLQLQQLQGAITAGKNTMLNAAAAMYAVRPLSEEE